MLYCSCEKQKDCQAEKCFLFSKTMHNPRPLNDLCCLRVVRFSQLLQKCVSFWSHLAFIVFVCSGLQDCIAFQQEIKKRLY